MRFTLPIFIFITLTSLPGCQTLGAHSEYTRAKVEPVGRIPIERPSSCQKILGNKATTERTKTGIECTLIIYPKPIVEMTGKNLITYSAFAEAVRAEKLGKPLKEPAKEPDHKALLAKLKDAYEKLPPDQQCPVNSVPTFEVLSPFINCVTKWTQSTPVCSREPGERDEPQLIPPDGRKSEFCRAHNACRDGFDLLFLGVVENHVVNIEDHCVQCPEGTVFDSSATNKVPTDMALRKLVGCPMDDSEACAVCRVRGP